MDKSLKEGGSEQVDGVQSLSRFMMTLEVMGSMFCDFVWMMVSSGGPR